MTTRGDVGHTAGRYIAVKASGAYTWHHILDGINEQAAGPRTPALCGWTPGAGSRDGRGQWKRFPNGRARWLRIRADMPAEHACADCTAALAKVRA